MMRANALYEGLYLLAPRSSGRRRQRQSSRSQVGADAVAMARPQGNDKVRLEPVYALAPDIKVMAPWRDGI